ncbi:MAG: hypothetical protein GTO14_03440 [Anaerolineales bacterium]|nr:hypothetical protein [Anaerolineales bacterium]
MLAIAILSFAIWILVLNAAAYGFGGPECFNDYDYGEGWLNGCWGGRIRFRSYAVVNLGAALSFLFVWGYPVFVGPFLVTPMKRSIRRWRNNHRSHLKARVMFRWLDSTAPP